jgi:hypothetical protein
VFFANSGAEAMECCIKMARKYHSYKGAPERYRIITFEGAFHGAKYPPSRPIRPSIWRASGRRWTASIRCRSAISRLRRRPSDRKRLPS